MPDPTTRRKRAREIVARHEIGGLDYMSEDPLADGTQPERFMLVTHTVQK